MIAQSPREVVLDLSLHDAQMQVMRSEARYKVVPCGRRFGKTYLGVGSLIRAAGEKPGSINWWVAPRYDQTDVALRWFTEALPSELVDLNLTKKTARLWNGSIVAFKTGNDPNALRSEGLDYVVLDEAAFLKSDVWFKAIRPALSDKKGEALLIGTFDGENWFYDLYERGQSDAHSEWESWRFVSADNPFLDPEEIAEAERTLPKAVFEQEYMANPLVYAGSVFEGSLVQASVDRGLHTETGTYHAGLDWGYSNETAFEVCREDAEGRIDWLDEKRWVATELNTRCNAIAEMCRDYDIESIAADAAGATEIRTLAETLQRHGLRTTITPVPFGKFKHTGISTRRWYLERGLEAMGPRCKTLAAETKRYRYKEGTEDVVKEQDHGIDALTAFYSTRAHRMVRG